MEKLFNEYGYYDGLEFPEECINDCSHSGSVDEDIEYWQKKLNFQVPRELTINYLRDFGAWNLTELNKKSDDDLAQIVLWIACCNIKEDGKWSGLIH